MRVLVTGSRDWTDRDALRAALDAVLARCHGLILVHGACPNGADALADEWARERQAEGRNILIDRFPANWGSYGRAAGMRRNAEMVGSGINLCLAFFQPGAANRGTAHCAKLARRAGVDVLRYPEVSA